MKVVLFCGGLGMRLREYSEVIPKPMIPIGYRPILWHIMKYYAHYGHNDFILCLGYGGDSIKNFFLNYNECASNDFTLTHGGKNVKLHNKDIDDWTINFVDTGLQSNLGQRLKAVEHLLEGEEMFLANYSDGLTDCSLPVLLKNFQASGAMASFLCVKPPQSFHVVETAEDGIVQDITHVTDKGIWINGGYFVFRKEIFDYMEEGEELVEAPFRRLIKKNKLLANKYSGFFATMDTFKEKQHLDHLCAQGKLPWQVWKEKENSCISKISKLNNPSQTKQEKVLVD
jgi:glucose-1-phosphate cytidylyltransferase